VNEREGTRVKACARLDVRVMGRVYVRVLHKSCLIHFDLFFCPYDEWYQVVSLTLFCTSSVFDHSVSLVSPNVHWMELVLGLKFTRPMDSVTSSDEGAWED